MTIKYEFQIQVPDSNRVMTWRSVRPTGGQPYQYDTKTEAHQAADMLLSELAQIAGVSVPELKEILMGGDL